MPAHSIYRLCYALVLTLSALSETSALPSPWVMEGPALHNSPMTAKPHIGGLKAGFRHARRSKGYLIRRQAVTSTNQEGDSCGPSQTSDSQTSAPIAPYTVSSVSAMSTASPLPIGQASNALRNNELQSNHGNATTGVTFGYAINATAFISGTISYPSPTASATVSADSPQNTLIAAPKGLAISYYPDWNGDIFPPENVDYSKFDIIYFAFALPAADFSLYFTQTDSVSLLQRLVKQAHARGVQVLVSIGGWTGSAYFSQAVSNAANREIFANNMVTMMKTYNLDGLDIDWEYPGSAGASNNYASADSANLALFLQLLRSKVGSKKLITMATGVQPFAGPNGQPLSSVSAHAKILDHILIMNYDVWGSSANPGPNAPLSNGCGNSLQPQANAAAAIKNWSAAGMPPSKIMLGLPAYGYVSSSTARKLVDRDLAEDFNGHRMFEANVLEGRNRRKDAQALRMKRKRAQVNNLREYIVTKVQDGTTYTYCPGGHGDTCISAGNTAVSVPSKATTQVPTSVFNPTATNKAKAVVGNGDVSAWMGSQIPFKSIISQGVLQYQTSNQSFIAANGYTLAWDSCSSTPFLYNTARKVVVTFDNPKSIGMKVAYALSQHVGGFGFWDMSSDTANYDLMRAARAAWGMSA